MSQQSLLDGKWCLVAFYSKFLSPVEHNYEIHNKEILAIIWTLEEWRYFLKGIACPVEIWTNYKNLEYFMIAKKLNHCQAYWSLYLAHFDFSLCHCSGYSMEKPNTLSQRPDHSSGATDNEGITLPCPELFTIHTLKEVELTGVEQEVLSKIHHGNCKGDLKGPITKAAQKLQQSTSKLIHLSEWSNINGLLHF